MLYRLILILTVACVSLPAADWPVSGGIGGVRYSTLDHINRTNVSQLRLAWQFDSHDEFPGSEMQCNPVILDGILYATTPRLRVIALNAATGKLIWDFDAHRGEKVTGKQRSRGLAVWTDSATKQERRIFAYIDEYVYALDAATGQPISSFGEAGRIDLRKGLGNGAETLNVRATSPGVVYRDLLIQGSLVAEDLPAAPGHIRAYDVHTGKIRWTFHTIPLPGEFGYKTWPKNAWQRIGGANSWPGMTLDAARGMVFVPTGSASFDFYGANRLGNDLFANCLLALDANTGKRIWHFQFVHHDLWDRDLPAAPTLVQLHRNAQTIDAVAQITKSGFVWLFDRNTGKPLTPYKEVAVAPTDVDGEKTSPTQPLPLSPAPFARQQLTEDMLTDRTPAAHAAVLEQFRKIRSGPQFTPPSREGTIVFPGFDGGGEWGGGAWDPETGIFYVNANEMPWILRLVPRGSNTGAQTGATLYRQNCSGCHRPDRSGSPPEFPSLLKIGDRLSDAQIKTTLLHGAGRMPGFAQLGEAAVNAIVKFVTTGENVQLDGAEHANAARPAPLKYGIDGYNKFLDPDGYPAVKPPWGTLNAIDLNTGTYSWKIPFGEVPALAQSNPGSNASPTGSENYGGSVVTAGGLLFIGATDLDHKFRAFDKLTGTVLWETTLPAGGNATPAIYSVDGREFIVIAAGGGKSGAISGGSYVAFALPQI